MHTVISSKGQVVIPGFAGANEIAWLPARNSTSNGSTLEYLLKRRPAPDTTDWWTGCSHAR